ncbi:FMRFamide receptor-like [Physella acuta]|uniref:FMRFamide receptor-like n=1 Tax=Physella acuta TaxID=109671 RepID=UPI0027DC98B3|nr:FMRFamide receptor-like [Physella acuta]
MEVPASSTERPASTVPVVDPSVVGAVMIACSLVFGEIVGTLGIIGNIITIIIFIKQGFDDTVNITLTALAVSDIGALVTLQLFNVMVNPFFLSLDVNFLVIEVNRVISFYPHNYFIRVTGFITAFAAFERCLCVVKPLHVKQIITRNVSFTFNVLVFFVTIFNIFPIMYTGYFQWKFPSKLNKTYLGVAFSKNAQRVFSVSYFITDLFVPYFTFFIIITCTTITGIKLKTKAAWRKTATGASGKPKAEISNKERKVVVMLITVSVIFVVCLIPQSAILTAVGLVQELSVSGQYFDVAFICYCVSFVAETINSSVNIIVYFKMSSRFRNTFLELFGLKK